MTDSKEYAFLGWQGFGLEHPADWELNRIKGSRRTTYLSLDDGTRVRLEVNWRPVQKTVSLETLVDKQAATLSKAAGRRRLKLKVNRKKRVGRVRAFNYETFTWTADVSACELVARCKRCSRVILIRVIGDKAKLPTDEAAQIFSSLACYCEQDFERWGAFGLDVQIPAAFELEYSSLKAGLCELTFSDRKTELKIMRVSMARMILEDKKMVAWYEALAPKQLRPFDVTWREESFRSHLGYRGGGEPRSNRKLLGFFRSARRLCVVAFYCEPTDKIFVVSADGTGDVEKLVDTVREGLVCHD